MKLKDFFSVKNALAVVLLTMTWLASGCSKENNFTSEEPAAPPASVSFELKTELDSVSPVMLLPDSVFRLEYTAEHVKSVEAVDVQLRWMKLLEMWR